MITTVACVLRSGGEYKPEHVVSLYRGVQRHWDISRLGYLYMICLTDVPFLQFGVACIPLVGGWPGWWSKMELFRPDLRGDLFYLDLDTVVVGSLGEVASVGQPTILRDLFHRDVPCRQGLVGSGLMYLPEVVRPSIWRDWIRDPNACMRKHQARGDQAFIEEHAGGWARWQDVLPDQVISYKVHVQPNKGRVPDKARVVCFHGRPRPWQVPPLTVGEGAAV